MKTDISDELMLHGNNAIPLNALPLGKIEVGASLPGFTHSAANKKQLLNGIFMVIGSAMLIESSVTTIVLDLEFNPNLSY